MSLEMAASQETFESLRAYREIGFENVVSPRLDSRSVYRGANRQHVKIQRMSDSGTLRTPKEWQKAIIPGQARATGQESE